MRAYMVGRGLRQAASSEDSGRPRWLPLNCAATSDCGATSAIDSALSLSCAARASSTHDSSVACQVGLNYGSNGYGVLGHWHVAAARTCRSSDAHHAPRRYLTTYERRASVSAFSAEKIGVIDNHHIRKKKRKDKTLADNHSTAIICAALRIRTMSQSHEDTRRHTPTHAV